MTTVAISSSTGNNPEQLSAIKVPFAQAVATRWSLYKEVTKSRIVMMVLVTFGVGFVLGAEVNLQMAINWKVLIAAVAGLFGTALSAAGAGALNSYLERDLDAQMKRTMHRPLPTGRISAGEVALAGSILSIAGVSVLLAGTNLLTAALSLLSIVLYVCVYTPLKRITWLNTTIGAIPGALPALGGWSAATGSIDALGVALFLLLFVWQHPHFYALAWLYRQDYERGGYAMLPVVDRSGSKTFRHILVYSILLLPVSVLPVMLGVSGSCYYYGALCLSALLLAASVLFSLSRSTADARRLFHATLLYFPLLLICALSDMGIRAIGM